MSKRFSEVMVRSLLFVLGLIGLVVGVAAGAQPLTGRVLPSAGGVSIDVLGLVGAEADVPCGSVFAPARVDSAEGPLDDVGRVLLFGGTNCDELLAEREPIAVAGIVGGGFLVLLSFALTLLVVLGRGLRRVLRL